MAGAFLVLKVGSESRGSRRIIISELRMMLREVGFIVALLGS
jgi:hypothetical protein